MLYGFCLDS